MYISLSTGKNVQKKKRAESAIRAQRNEIELLINEGKSNRAD